MRRKDREMDRDFGLAIIDQAEYGILSMVDDNQTPYGVPLSLVRVNNTLYFHAAKVGRKADILAKNTAVSIAFIGCVKVPQKYSDAELDEIVKQPSKVGTMLSNVFTTEFESTIITGKAVLVVEEAEKTKALQAICQKYTPTKMQYADIAIKAGVSGVAIYKIEIETLSAKCKKL